MQRPAAQAAVRLAIRAERPTRQPGAWLLRRLRGDLGRRGRNLDEVLPLHAHPGRAEGRTGPETSAL